MADLIKFLRRNKYEAKYDSKFNKKWSDNELLNHIVKLDYSYNQLTDLPTTLCVFCKQK